MTYGLVRHLNEAPVQTDVPTGQHKPQRLRDFESLMRATRAILAGRRPGARALRVARARVFLPLRCQYACGLALSSTPILLFLDPAIPSARAAPAPEPSHGHARFHHPWRGSVARARMLQRQFAERQKVDCGFMKVKTRSDRLGFFDGPCSFWQALAQFARLRMRVLRSSGSRALITSRAGRLIPFSFRAVQCPRRNRLPELPHEGRLQRVPAVKWFPDADHGTGPSAR